MIDGPPALRSARPTTALAGARWSHDLTGVPPARGSTGPAATSVGERRRANAEALEGVQQIEAGVLGLGFGMDDFRQLAGERHLSPDSPQAAGVLGVLIAGGKTRVKRRARNWKKPELAVCWGVPRQYSHPGELVFPPEVSPHGRSLCVLLSVHGFPQLPADTQGTPSGKLTFSRIRSGGGGACLSTAGSRRDRLRLNLPLFLHIRLVRADNPGFFGAPGSEGGVPP